MRQLKKMNYCFQKVDNVHQIYLYDDVSKYGEFNWETWDYDESETSAKHFAEVLNAIPETDKIELFINSRGGDADQGTAIFNLLNRHGAYKTGYVDGVAHSIAFTIFQACDRRIMGEGTSAIIHDMWGCFSGNSRELRQYADNLDVWMDSCVSLFMKRAKNITEDELRELMHTETALSPQDALNYGFCDEIGTVRAEIEENQLKQLNEENQLLRQQIRNGTEFQKQLVEFYQSTHKAEGEKEHSVKQGTGFGAFFMPKIKEER